VAGADGADAGAAKKDERNAAKKQAINFFKDLITKTGRIKEKPGFLLYAT
jgi:hypothetical protein